MALLLIIVFTVSSSLVYMNREFAKEKLMFSPYNCKHDHEFYRFFSHILIHADVTHLLFNMISLYFLGDFMLKSLSMHYGDGAGSFHFLVLYIAGGFFATLLPYLRHQDDVMYRSLGASGSVSAVIFGAILWQPELRLSLFFIPIAIPAYIFGPLYLAFEFYAHKKGRTGIAHDAHIGGALFGLIYIAIIQPIKIQEFIQIFTR